MVVINATELEVYTNVFAVAYAARANASLSSGFEFPIGEVMIHVKGIADNVDTVAALSKRVLAEAVALACNERDLT